MSYRHKKLLNTKGLSRKINHYKNLTIKVIVTHICISITQEADVEGSWEPRSLKSAWTAEHDPVSVN